MKAQKILMLLAACLLLTACGDDGGDEGNRIEPKTNPNPTPANVNNNKNTTGPAEAQYRLEFPKLKGDPSVVVVHRAILNGKTKEEGVNYCGVGY